VTTDSDARDELLRLADLAAALAEHVVDLDRRVCALEQQKKPPKRIAASELRNIAKALMTLSLLQRRRRP